MLSARCRCCFRCCLRVSLHKLYKSVTSHGVMTATAISERPSTFSAKLRAHQALSLEGFSWGWRHQSSCKGSVGALFAGLVLGLGRACPLARRQPRRGSAGGQVLWSSIRIRLHQPRRRRARTHHHRQPPPTYIWNDVSPTSLAAASCATAIARTVLNSTSSSLSRQFCMAPPSMSATACA